MIVGLFFSNALLSISTGVLFVVSGINQIYKQEKIKFNILQYAFLSLFIIYFIWSFYHFSTINDSIKIIVSKLSLLGVALFLPNIIIQKKQQQTLINIALSIIFIISLYTIILFFNDTIFWKDAYSKGQVLPTFIHHSKFSFILFCSVVVLIFNYKNKYYYNILIIYFIIYLHFLSVKTGLLLLYLFLFCVILYQIVNKKWYYLLLFLVPIILYKASPTLQQKLAYIEYDIHQLKNKNSIEYSDARRIISYQIAFDIFKENKLLGVGLSNYKNITQEKFIEKYNYYDNEKMMYVHNSYLHILASCGILGLILFLISIISIIYYYIKKQDFLVFSLVASFFICCFWDAYTEQLAGLSILILIVILGKQYANKNE